MEAVNDERVRDFIDKVFDKLNASWNQKFKEKRTDSPLKYYESAILFIFDNCPPDGEAHILINQEDSRSGQITLVMVPHCLYNLFEVSVEYYPISKRAKQVIESMSDDEWDEYQDL